jgi:hypothetical protein
MTTFSIAKSAILYPHTTTRGVMIRDSARKEYVDDSTSTMM